MKKAKIPWTAHILTLFPEMFPGPLGFSIIGKALEEKNWLLELIKLQNFSKKGPKYVDDKPYGGGPGMIIKSEIVHEALKQTIKKIKKKEEDSKEPVKQAQAPKVDAKPVEKLQAEAHKQDAKQEEKLQAEDKPEDNVDKKE